MSNSDKILDARAAAPLQDSVIVTYIPVIGMHTRLIKVVKTTEDPLQPPKFKFTRIPKAARISPPPAVLQSPPREDEKNWKVSPCVSLWKNPMGYAIPQDKRQSAAELEPEISHRVADVAEALYAAEEKSRDEVTLRGKIRRESEMREKERRDKELQELARIARDELGQIGEEVGAREQKREREELGGDGAGMGKKKKSRGLAGDDDEVKTTMKMREREKEDDDDLFGLDEFLSNLDQ